MDSEVDMKYIDKKGIVQAKINTSTSLLNFYFSMLFWKAMVIIPTLKGKSYWSSF
jgi:hypothetical protein